MKILPEVVLKKSPPASVRHGHPWFYRSQIQGIHGTPIPGGLVRLVSASGKFLGTGYFNDKSEITIRLLSPEATIIDKNFFKIKIEKALEFRNRFVKDTNAYRLVWSEADSLPGLIIDQYDQILVTQFLTLGMDRFKEIVFETIRELFPSKRIYERSDSSSRRLEGLEDKVGWIDGCAVEEVTIHERNIHYAIHFGQGHKTGFYLDQRENRFLMTDLKLGGRVLDAFCYEGGFGLHLAASGAKVLGIDIQETAIIRARENSQLNNLSAETCEWRVANVFVELKELDKSKEKFDLVILDPPSFVKKKSALEGALAGYKEIMLRSMKILNPGGCLAVFSCSYYVDENLLMQTALSAAKDTRRKLRLVKFLKQSADHPINPLIPETYYLKGFLFMVQ